MAQQYGSGSDKPDHEVLIIGTGFAGLCMAIQLKKAGITDFTMLEKEADLGGTWYVNTYPGCACDVPSHLYSFSFEPNPDWSREFASQPEILSYIRRTADKHGLRPRVQFKAQAVGARFDEAAQLWRVSVAAADEVAAFMEARGLKPGDVLPKDDAAFPRMRELSARFVVAGMGGLSTPAYPSLPGIEKFEGETFHSQRWNHGYDLTGKRVAVIGTGASAIQFVPAIQPKVARMDVYQRTPPWVMPKPNPEISARRKALYRFVPPTRAAERLRLYALMESRAIAFTYKPELTKEAERFARAYIKRRIADPELRKKLTPNYSMGCKRVLLSSEWYPALTQPNVGLVTEGIREVRAHSIVDSAGVEREVDCIIYGTGFRLTDLVPRGVIYGRGGKDLVDGWPHGPEAYKGTTIAGCPNLFILVGPNTGLGHNSIIYMIEAQVAYIMDALKLMREQGYATLEVKADVQAAFNEQLQKKSAGTVWEQGGCKSYYLHPESGRNVAVWPDFTFRFAWVTRKFDGANYVLEAPSPQRAAASEAAE
jgi:cation diffusion facilitator CzcD-associated flavoprotein CzcO